MTWTNNTQVEGRNKGGNLKWKKKWWGVGGDKRWKKEKIGKKSDKSRKEECEDWDSREKEEQRRNCGEAGKKRIGAGKKKRGSLKKRRARVGKQR